VLVNYLKKFLGLFLVLLFISVQHVHARDAISVKKLSLVQCFRIHKNLETGNSQKITKSIEKLMLEKHKELEGLNYVGVVAWKPQKRKVVKRFFVEKFKVEAWAQPLPQFDKTQKLGETIVNVSDIKWSQVHGRNMSQDGKYSVVQNAHDLKSGKLSVTKLPTIKVWRDTDGRIWTLDHRRLAAIKLSGAFQTLKVEFVSEDIVKAQQFKFGTQNEGQSLFVYQDEKTKKTDLAVILMD
jgi:hypothetical protein